MSFPARLRTALNLLIMAINKESVLPKNEKKEKNSSSTTKRDVENALIVAGYVLFHTLFGMASTGQLFQKPVECMISALIAFGTAFFSALMAMKGLKKYL